MTLEIKTIPAVYAYAFYWILMMVFALSPFLWERQTLHVTLLSLSLGAITLVVVHNIKRYFKNINSMSISLTPVELSGGLLIIFGAIVAGFFAAG